MPKKTVTLRGKISLGTARVNNYGFPEIENAVSKSTVKRWVDCGSDSMDCDPVCDIKYWQPCADRYGYSRQQMMNIAKTEPKFHYVQIGKNVFFCSNTCDHFFKSYYWPKRNQKWQENFTDISPGDPLK